MKKRLCTVMLFFTGYAITMNMYLDTKTCIKDQVFGTYGPMGLKDFKWIKE